MYLLIVLTLAIFIATTLPTADGYTYQLSNRLFHDIILDSPSPPDETTVRDWLLKLQAAINGCVSLLYTERLAKLLISRAKLLRWKQKSFKGSARKMQYLQQNWDLVVLENEHVPVSDALPACSSSAAIGSRKRTAKHYSKRHERRLKKQRVTDCTNALNWLENEGFTPISLTVMNHSTKSSEIFRLRHNMDSLFDLDGESFDRNDEERVLMMLYIKDKHNVSGRAYHELASLCKQMPRHYKLKHKIMELNSLWNISPTPDGTCGVQQSLRERLTSCLKNLIPVLRGDTVHVKLTGDGTRLGKHLHVVNFAFTILDEGSKAHGPTGNHCIAIFKEEESYAAMRQCLEDIVKEVEELNSITVCDRELRICYYLGGDWKFLAMITGIDSATSTYACIWCKCPSLERYDTLQTWSISDTELGARTIEENIRLARSRTKNRYNVSNEPIFRTIPLTRVVVDNLHMFLRVADTLIDLLLGELRRLDNIEKSRKVKSLDSLHYIKLYESTVRMIGISGFSFWIGRESKTLKCRTLTGPEKLVLFKELNVAETFPQVPDVLKVQALWGELLLINKVLSVERCDVTPSMLNEFEQRSTRFIQRFVEIYPAKHVTPYMHCMAQHVREFFAIHGALLPFTQQGLEKYNDSMTKDYFRSSSHRGTECLTQILQKQNRLEYLEQAGAKRTANTMKCSICLIEGHNRLTCPQAKE